MVAMGVSGAADIPFMVLVGSIVPIAVGCVLGNLDEDIREFCAPGATMMIPFFAFPLGAGLNFMQLLTAGIPGIFLGVICCLLTGLGGYLCMRLIRASTPKLAAPSAPPPATRPAPRPPLPRLTRPLLLTRLPPRPRWPRAAS